MGIPEFATLGVRVIIVEKRPRSLEFADAEMVEALSYHMRDRRATMRLNEEVESVEELPDGKVAANLVSQQKAHHWRCVALRGGPQEEYRSAEPGSGGN